MGSHGLDTHIIKTAFLDVCNFQGAYRSALGEIKESRHGISIGLRDYLFERVIFSLDSEIDFRLSKCPSSQKILCKYSLEKKC